MVELYNQSAISCSTVITQMYSTSFSLGIKALDKKYHWAIYSIYGLVRYADEIVDTLHHVNKRELLQRFRNETFRAIEEGVSINPILHAFQIVVHTYGIKHEYIHAFFDSMEMDVDTSTHEHHSYTEYIYGSAEVVGLMCLQVFCEGNTKQFDSLVEPARALGAAFQKVNFLRDIKSDFEERGRVYFPDVNIKEFNAYTKQLIERDIEHDFTRALEGIKQLPEGARFGVYLAYVYYIQLFKKIKNTSAEHVASTRVRVSTIHKAYLLVKSFITCRMFKVELT